MTTTSILPFTAEEKAELLQKMRDRDAYLASIKPTVIPPCPAWCTQPAGHDYDSVDDVAAAFIRDHSSGGDGRRAYATQLETNTAGVVELVEPSIFVDEEDLDADQARKLAADLVAAAELLDSLVGTT